MAFKGVRRQKRYSILRDAGFQPFEARPLSRVPMKVAPYVREMIRDRQKMKQKAIAEGASRAEWERRIKALYADNRWFRLGKRRIESDPWRMLRDYEDRWRAKRPQYDSPWQKRQRNWRQYTRKYERTIAKQRTQGERAFG